MGLRKFAESPIGSRLTSAAGDVAGAVADPKTGWQKLRAKLGSPVPLIAAGVVAVVFLAGRRSARH
jgi:hypothetical protein